MAYSPSKATRHVAKFLSMPHEMCPNKLRKVVFVIIKCIRLFVLLNNSTCHVLNVIQAMQSQQDFSKTSCWMKWLTILSVPVRFTQPDVFVEVGYT